MRQALRQLSLGIRGGKTAGRNSAGRITSFHRGGGAKRLQRKIDLKRSTSSMGIVERIEYDPNRTSRIALVRWIEGVQPKKWNNAKEEEFAPTIVSETTTDGATINNLFSCSSLLFPGKADPIKVAYSSPGPLDNVAVVGLPTLMNPLFKSQASPGSTRKTSAKDVFLSAFSSSTKAKGETAPVSFPRITVAGAKPTFFAPQMRGQLSEKNTVSLDEVRKWRPNSIIWEHKLKRKAALSWQSFRPQETLGLAGITEPSLSKMKTYQVGSVPAKLIGEGPKDEGAGKMERAPFSYIIASDKMEAGKMVMNCDWSKPSTSGRARNALSSSHPQADSYEIFDINSQVGNCIPLTQIRIGTWVHDIEVNPGQGAKLVRAAGTHAKVVKEPGSQCLVRLPSGVERLIDSRCRATIGTVSNINNNQRKLRKAGHSRWLGRRPVVRGVAMNPVDHPHGGGEGRTKGGRPSVTPWGKPTKSGYKTGAGKRKK